MSTHDRQHGTQQSYITGFILSLLFTVIPYELVRGHAASAKVLLAVILLIAVVQMIIQVLFFLHLGREQKPRWQLYFFAGTVFGIMTVVGGSIFIMAHLHHSMGPIETTTAISQDEAIAQVNGVKTGACQAVRQEHQVTIVGGIASPLHIDARQCDALVFTTADKTSWDIVFGARPQTVPYAGTADLAVSKTHGNMLILSATGSYQFRDRLDPTLSGTFSVAP